MSCCREIGGIEVIWLKDASRDSLVVRHVLTRFAGDYNGYAVFRRESGGLQWYAWFRKDDAGQFVDAHLGFRRTTDAAVAAAIDNFGGGATTLYRLCVWDNDAGAWIVQAEAGILPTDPTDSVLLLELFPFGITIFTPEFRTWQPLGSETAAAVTYDQARNPGTRIRMRFHCLPFDPEADEFDVEKIFHYLGVNGGGTDEDLEFATLAGADSYGIEPAAMLVTPSQFVYQADEPPGGDPVGDMPVRLCLSFSQCRVTSTPTDVRVATLVVSGDVPVLGVGTHLWDMAIYSAWAGAWTPVSVQGWDPPSAAPVERNAFRPCDRSAFPANLTYDVGSASFGQTPLFITVSSFEVLPA